MKKDEYIALSKKITDYVTGKVSQLSTELQYKLEKVQQDIDGVAQKVATDYNIKKLGARNITGYTFTDDVGAHAEGTIYIKPISSADYGDYYFYWADNNNVSSWEYFGYIETVNSTSEWSFAVRKYTMIPPNATRVLVYKGEDLYDYMDIPREKQFTKHTFGEKLYSFGVMSDLGVASANTGSPSTKIPTALNFFKDYGCDFVSVCGDVTVNGTSAEYVLYNGYIDDVDIDVYESAGFHDATTSTLNKARHHLYTGGNQYFTQIVGDDVFIYFGAYDYDITAPFTTTALTWLETQLTTYASNRVFLITHPYLYNTCGNYTPSGSLDNEFLTVGNTQEVAFRALLADYDNVIMFCGVSHFDFELQNYQTNANIYRNTDGAYMLHVPSLTNPKYYDGSNVYTDTAKSYAYVVDVYENSIVVKGIIDFAQEFYSGLATYFVEKDSNVATGTSAVNAGYKLSYYTPYDEVTASSNVYNLNINNRSIVNLAIETTDANGKSFSLTNIPKRCDLFIELKYTNAAAMTWMSNTTWQLGTAPTLIAGKTYRIAFFTKDAGATWHAYITAGI